MQDGRRIEFKTRTKSGMRGFAGVDLLVLDEAMIICGGGAFGRRCRSSGRRRRRGGRSFGTRARRSTRRSQDHGVVWTRVRERGIAGDDPALAYFEWSLDFEHPDDVPDEIAGGRGAVAAGELRDRRVAG